MLGKMILALFIVWTLIMLWRAFNWFTSPEEEPYEPYEGGDDAEDRIGGPNRADGAQSYHNQRR